MNWKRLREFLKVLVIVPLAIMPVQSVFGQQLGTGSTYEAPSSSGSKTNRRVNRAAGNIVNQTGTSQPVGTAEERPKSTAPAIRDMSDQNTGQNDAGSSANAMMGAALMAAGAAMMANPPTMPPGMVLMAMGIMAMMQSANHAGTADGSKYVSGLVDYGGYNSPGGIGGGSGIPTQESLMQNGMTQQEAQTALASLNQAQASGFGVDTKSGNVTLPDGTVLSPQDVMSPESLASKGFSLDDAQMAFDTMNSEAEKVENSDRMIAAMDTGSGGGGGGGGGRGRGGSFETSHAPADDPFGSGGGGSGDDKKNKVAGMSKNFNGEPIGVASDDIFKMMTRRYNLKQRQNYFLGESEAPPK